MRLKSIELLGYKTFADHAQFVFDEGITSIVGPNGSGKSNVADAVRWALGEQSYSLLRARRSEDMIFSGSERRARMGMAEVTITLDNSAHWLPIDFEEVAITRRSYRSGENEYRLNGSRVRLREIVELLSQSGLSKRTYTVVGQGLIDTALSLRPQERRRLLEEAAGLTLYQARREEALDRLEETRQNLLRVHDLTAEIGPQVRRLERQAARAREYEQVRDELEQVLRIWYSYRWKRGGEELRRVRSVAAYQEERVTAQRARVRELSDEIAAIRARQTELRDSLGQWHRESSALHARSEAQQRELAVAQERRRGTIQRRDEIQSEIVPLEVAHADQIALVAQTEAELSTLVGVLQGQQDAVAQARAQVDAHQAALAALQAARREAEEALLSLRATVAERESRVAQLGERRIELAEARAAYDASARTLAGKAARVRGEVAEAEGALSGVVASLADLAEQSERCEPEIESAQEAQRALGEQRNALDQRIGRLRERHELLTRMHDEGAGLYEGVRTVLRTGLHGVAGTVAELIDVPPELETAIEVALGGQLQDVVVGTWDDAQAAIDHLKRTRGGRATFLPLDTIRAPEPVRAPRMPGVEGVASDLVSCAPEHRPVVTHLLCRTLVCSDLAVARRVLGTLSGSYQIVTREGEQVRSTGSVTGGTRAQGQRGGMLARERERREIPRQLRTLDGQRSALDGEIERAGASEASLRRTQSVLAAQRAKLSATQRELEGQALSLRQEAERAQNEAQWYRSLIADLDGELAGLDEREQELRHALAEAHEDVARARATQADLDLQIERADDQDLREQLSARLAEAAATRQEQASKEAELRAYRQRAVETERQIARRVQRVDELSAQIAQVEERVTALRAVEGSLAVDLQSYASRIEPAEAELQELEARQADLEAREEQARLRLQARESRYSQAQLAVARQEDRMSHLRSQIEDDLGLVDLDLGETLSGQPLLPIEPLVSSLPEVEMLPEGTEEQIRELRRHLNRLGTVNLDAPQEYEETLARYEFLVSQSQDLEHASTDLRQVIAELDDVMQREFQSTYRAVAREFESSFKRLFNGGSARLQLTAPDDLMNTGIDIIARPPGKRQQGLAVLSGGERALTAAALIFAILRVSPTPFCVLDEVDAALDEANVGRFREVLKELAKETQFVVITHNRYTIEVSDIVYGISMRPDGASCVISHRMRERA
ncbi:MAG: chromosome segregation protein SMC [Anaerolineae bacterium]|nr:chromosome segregation protein SMC [Anaerolineae bacterium]